MSNWIDIALKEVVAAIQSGSVLKLGGLEDGFKYKYRQDFLKNGAESWGGAKEMILELSVLIGATAQTLTLARAWEDGNPTPEYLDAECAYLAGLMVRDNTCPLMPPIIGVWCAGYSASQIQGSDEFEALEDSLGKILGKVKVKKGGPQAIDKTMNLDDMKASLQEAWESFRRTKTPPPAPQTGG